MAGATELRDRERNQRCNATAIPIPPCRAQNPLKACGVPGPSSLARAKAVILPS